MVQGFPPVVGGGGVGVLGLPVPSGGVVAVPAGGVVAVPLPGEPGVLDGVELPWPDAGWDVLESGWARLWSRQPPKPVASVMAAAMMTSLGSDFFMIVRGVIGRKRQPTRLADAAANKARKRSTRRCRPAIGAVAIRAVGGIGNLR